METKKYTKDGIIFKSVKLPQTLFREGPIGITPTQSGQNAEDTKGIHYNGDTIDSVVPFINAVDIDWNGVVFGNEEIYTTSELLKKIKESLSNQSSGQDGQDGQNGLSAFEIWQHENWGERRNATYDDFWNFLKGDKGDPGEDGQDGQDGNNGKDGEDGQAAIIEIGTTQTGSAGTDAIVTNVGTPSHAILNFVIPRGRDGSSSGGSGTGEANIINSISINGIDVSPDSNKNVNIDLSNYATTGALQQGLATKQNTLVSAQNIRQIKYSNSPGVNTDWKYISLLPQDDGNTSVSSDPNYNPKDTSPYSSGNTINMAKVAFTGKYNDLINRPDDDKYIKIFRKSLREEATTSYPDKDSIQRVVYKCVSQGQKSVVAGEQYGIENYTEEEILHHNQSLPGAILGGTILSENPIPDPIHPEDSSYNTPSAQMVNTKIGTNYNIGDTISALDANSYNATLEGAIDEYEPKTGTEPRTNIHDENVFIQNQVLGDHAVALSWGGIIGSNQNSSLQNGNYGFTEGKETKVYGDFSHSSGYKTETRGDYSYNGGLNIEDGVINGNFSLGYGNSLITTNNGEIAFGAYNKSTTLLTIERPEANQIALDNKNNHWKIVDYYNVTLGDFIENIDLEFGDFYQGKENYNFGCEALTISENNIIYNNNYNFTTHGNDSISSNYTSFINRLVNVGIIESGNNDNQKAMNVYNFLIETIYTLNYHKPLYIYNYSSIDHPENGVESNNIIGVIAQKVDENGNPIQKIDEHNDPIFEGSNPVYEYKFFVWGPDYLYYEHTPITKLSIGNGISEESRNNLIEVTDDGNIHYAKGERNLFALENEIQNIQNNLGLNVEEVNIESEDSRLDQNLLILNVEDSTPSKSIIEIDDNLVKSIQFSISESDYDYYEKVFIFDSTQLVQDYNHLIFNSSDCELYLNDFIGRSSDSKLIFDDHSIADVEINQVGLIYKISIEVIANKRFINIEEYSKIETESE